MKITHTKVNNKKLLAESLLEIDKFNLKIKINCLDVYSKHPGTAANNKIAELLESFRRREINIEQFVAGYKKIKLNLLENFCNKFYIDEKEIVFYAFRSHNKFINNVLSELKNACIKKMKRGNIDFVDISSCLTKIKGKDTSKKQTFETILTAYKFKPDALFHLGITTKNKIKHLYIIDDVVSKGKAAFALLKNLYDKNIINVQTKVTVNCIYCIEERYKELL